MYHTNAKLFKIQKRIPLVVQLLLLQKCNVQIHIKMIRIHSFKKIRDFCSRLDLGTYKI